MRRPSRPGLSLVLALCAGIPLTAQNLASIGKEKPFSFSGSLSFNQIFYSSTGIAARRDPYRYLSSGNISLGLYGLNIPLTFSASNGNTSFTQPFNRYSVHPTWKWITAHAGYTAMSFSPYTVNGHVFLGTAVDLEPEGKWKFSALYGRFLKAVQPDTASETRDVPAFQRMGYGLKAHYGSGADRIELILFRAEDHAATLPHLHDSVGVTPQQNFVVSIAGGKTVFKHFLLKAELATTAITKDTRAQKTDHEHPLAKSGVFFQPRLSSSYHQAFKTSFDYQKAGWLFGLAYERIDPGYRTLGAYYFNNDLENITVNGMAALMQGKLNVSASTGIQRDNLDLTKVSTMRRMVGALNLNYAPSERLNLSAAYSSFQTFTHIRSQFEAINQLTPYESPDTLNFTQLSRNASLSGMYAVAATENRRQNINIQLTCQDAADRQGETERNSATRFYNFSAGYAMSFIPANMNVAISFNTTINRGAHFQSRMIGPTAVVSRTFFQRKLRTTLSSAYNRTYSHGPSINTIFNTRLNGALTVRNKHSVNLSTVMVKRITGTESVGKRFTELTATLGYAYSFGVSR